MSLRSLSDRARIESAHALRRALGGLVGHGRLTHTDLYVVRTSPPSDRDDADARSSSTPDAQTTPAASPDRHTNANESARVNPPGRDVEVTHAVNRVAHAIDRLAAQLDAYRAEQAEHWNTIEFLLREMVIVGVPAARPTVHGGVIDPDAIDLTGREPVIAGDPLQVDTPVDVRSRFQDRWVCGFVIAQAVESSGPFRYRLTRQSDGLLLPILFDACDVRTTKSTSSPHR